MKTIKYGELQKGDKLLFRQDENRNQFIDSIQPMIGNVLTFHSRCTNRSVKVYEDGNTHWFGIQYFTNVIRDCEVYKLE